MVLESRNRTTVLDHGYIELIESWGSDERIIEAARMSTKKGFEGWGGECSDCAGKGWIPDVDFTSFRCKTCDGKGESVGDEKLLRYLYEHRHHTPFEMAGFIIEIQAPIFVFREWHRHRTQCLAADTMISFNKPSGRSGPYRLPIGDLWCKWQPTERVTRPERQTNALYLRHVLSKMLLRCANEELNEITTTNIVDILHGEPKHMVRITTARNKSLTASLDHRMLTNNGWMPLSEAIRSGSLLAAEGNRRNYNNRWERPPVDESREEWKKLVNSDAYEVSSEGRVRTVKQITTTRVRISPGEILKTYPVSTGYECASIRNLLTNTTEARLVHTLVLEAFEGPKPTGYEARHLNNNTADARLSNLAWGTPAENAADRVLSNRQQKLVVNYEEIVSHDDVGDQPSFDLEVAGPWHNFVANGLIVHNSYNEMSARYTPIPDVNYLPTIERIMIDGGKNKQAQGLNSLTQDDAEDFLTHLHLQYSLAEDKYQLALKKGIPKELARLVVPVGRYSKMRASANLRNWLGFLTLRMDQAAQWEIRQYANQVAELVKSKFPRTYELFIEGMK